VIQDELDFALGTLRLQRKRSSAGHNGIESIINALGTQDFLRIRMGVDPGHKIEDGMSYLLAPFRKAQLNVVDEMLDVAADAVKAIVTEGAAAAMNRFNRRAETEKD
jgi:PTH1 family peptidyl-tRNA hydrolase